MCSWWPKIWRSTHRIRRDSDCSKRNTTVA
jgi:hypothetical protein